MTELKLDEKMIREVLKHTEGREDFPADINTLTVRGLCNMALKYLAGENVLLRDVANLQKTLADTKQELEQLRQMRSKEAESLREANAQLSQRNHSLHSEISQLRESADLMLKDHKKLLNEHGDTARELKEANMRSNALAVEKRELLDKVSELSKKVRELEDLPSSQRMRKLEKECNDRAIQRGLDVQRITYLEQELNTANGSMNKLLDLHQAQSKELEKVREELKSAQPKQNYVDPAVYDTWQMLYKVVPKLVPAKLTPETRPTGANLAETVKEVLTKYQITVHELRHQLRYWLPWDTFFTSSVAWMDKGAPCGDGSFQRMKEDFDRTRPVPPTPNLRLDLIPTE